jgi:hypothetical protein
MEVSKQIATLKKNINFMHRCECKFKYYLSVHLSVCLSVHPPIHPSIHPFIHFWFYSPVVGPCPLFSFSIFYTPWTGDQLVARPLPAHIGQHKPNKGTQISMPEVGSRIGEAGHRKYKKLKLGGREKYDRSSD